MDNQKKKIVRIIQAKDESIGSQIIVLMKTLLAVGHLKKEEKIVFDFSDIKWVQPLFLLPICCLINDLKRKRFDMVIKGPRDENLRSYLGTTFFPKGFSPKLKNDASKFLWSHFKNKTYLPIIAFPTAKDERTLKMQERLLYKSIKV